MRIAVAADLHRSEPDGSDIPTTVLEAFAGADLIVLCGDIGVGGTIKRFQDMAPVVAVRNDANEDDGEGLAPETTQVIEPEGTGLMFGVSFRPGPGLSVTEGKLEAEFGDARFAANEHFGAPIDVVLFGSTHESLVAMADGLLFVNPGSPTFADRRTVAIIEAHAGICQVEIVDV